MASSRTPTWPWSPSPATSRPAASPAGRGHAQAAPPRAGWQGAGGRLRRRGRRDAVARRMRMRGYWNAGQDCTAASRDQPAAVHDGSSRTSPTAVGSLVWATRPRARRLEMGPSGVRLRSWTGCPVTSGARGAEAVMGRTAAAHRAGAFYAAHRPRPAGAARRDRPGGGLRARRHGAALRRRRGGAPPGQRRPIRSRGLGVDRRHRPGDAGRRPSSSARSGSTSTSRSSRRCRTAASSSRAGARTSPPTRSRTTPSSST